MALFPHAEKPRHEAARPLGAGPGAVLAAALATALVLALPPPSASAATGSISGVAFQDLNQDGRRGADEAVFGNHQLYLFDPTGTYAGTTTTDAAGLYSFAGLEAGTYRVHYANSSWWAIRDDWVPTTTVSPRPVISVQVEGASTAHFGWRRLVRSTDVDSPISTYDGSTGLRVESFNDAVTAREIHDALAAGSIGAEATATVVRFGFSDSSSTTSSAAYVEGRYGSFKAICWVTYVSWLDEGDNTLSHEYGHAWSQYRAHIIHNDPAMESYLTARGLTGDPRVGTAYQWDPAEMIAEDYRQLLGSPSARGFAQMNRSVPPAAAVEGLEAFLRDTFSTPPKPAADPTPTPTPSPSASPAPAPTPTESASPTPSPTPSPSPTASPTATKGNRSGGGGGSQPGCKKSC